MFTVAFETERGSGRGGVETSHLSWLCRPCYTLAHFVFLVTELLCAPHDSSNVFTLAQACLQKSTHASAVTRVSRIILNMVAEPCCSSWQISERICEQIADVHVPQVVGQVLEAPKISSQDRNLQGTVEQIPDVLVPEMVEQLVKLSKTVSVNRIQERTAEGFLFRQGSTEFCGADR